MVVSGPREVTDDDPGGTSYIRTFTRLFLPGGFTPTRSSAIKDKRFSLCIWLMTDVSLSSLETNVSLQMTDTVFQYGGGIAYTFIPSARNGDLIGAVDPCGPSETTVSYIRRPRPQADPMPLMTRFGNSTFLEVFQPSSHLIWTSTHFPSGYSKGAFPPTSGSARSSRGSYQRRRRRPRMYEYRAHHAACEVLVKFCSTTPQSVRACQWWNIFPRVTRGQVAFIYFSCSILLLYSTFPPLLSEEWHSFPSSVGDQQGVLATMT
ncbi:hypothetical protein EDB85DRAFT_1135466 [Lactarius pseudohatsudake]|nr:hypothetical protein EDB85DRAFT_1135466 [Lactarius pseudohatsudake]